MGFGVWSLGFGVQGLGFGVWGLGFWVGVWGLGFETEHGELYKLQTSICLDWLGAAVTRTQN